MAADNWCTQKKEKRSYAYGRLVVHSEEEKCKKSKEVIEDWCALPDDLILLITRRLQLIEDFIAFRSVCSSWRTAATMNDCPKLPLLMSSFVFKPRKLMCHVTSLFNGVRKICNFSMPEAACGKAMHFFGSKGWLIMAQPYSTGGGGNMCLFHPFTCVEIPLPKAPVVKIPIWPEGLRSAALSASPFETLDYVVMIVFQVEDSHYPWFWKPGNKTTWTKVEIPSSYYVQDLNYYSGKFFALTSSGLGDGCYQVWMCDVCGPPNQTNNNEETIKLITELPWKNRRGPKAYLMDCQGRLFIVSPCISSQVSGRTKWREDVKMVEIDVIKGSYKCITSLGTSAGFLGCNQAFSIDSNEFPGIIQPDLVYMANGNDDDDDEEEEDDDDDDYYDDDDDDNDDDDGPVKTSLVNYDEGVWINF